MRDTLDQRADSLYTFRVSFPVVHALEQLQQDGDEKARQYLAAILRFEFIITLVSAEHILKSSVHLSTFLQGEKCDLVEAVKESEFVINQLTLE